MERVGLRQLAARSQIAKWHAALGDDAELTGVLLAAENENLRGPSFVAIIDQRIRTLQRTKERGLALPFAPNLIKSSP
jgi:hypothetical protein